MCDVVMLLRDNDIKDIKNNARIIVFSERTSPPLDDTFDITILGDYINEGTIEFILGAIPLSKKVWISCNKDKIGSLYKNIAEKTQHKIVVSDGLYNRKTKSNYVLMEGERLRKWQSN